ncbi:MAG: FKBP-type peptidyl-prolyl cis-trans isomerase [Polaromonas sp.]|nr:FKBP-type peptidyl-prolyl cis-trans isomerase [Polaromonas sp.]
MKITPQCVVALTWTLKDTLGEVLDELDEPIEFLMGGQDLLAKIEEHLQGHEAGEALAFQLEPEEAFGEYDESLVFLEQRVVFPAELEEGMTFDGATLPIGSSPDTPKDKIYTVTEIYPEHVVLDGNHPLAGIALRLNLKVESVRDATEAETGRGTLGTGFFRLEPLNADGPTLH